jgi:N,N'-diacetyllegionaminate synthase
MVNEIVIGNRRIGAAHRCYIIAEAGVNHNGDLALARRLVEAAADAGADAVKFQTFRADALATGDAPKAEYQKSSGHREETQRDLLRRLELSSEAHRELQQLCRSRGIVFLSSPFDEESAVFLRDLGVPALKIPSGEITNLPYLREIAKLSLPLILSSGMATLSEVAEAMDVINAAGECPLALLHCVSNYPAQPAWCNLKAMDTMAAAFRVPIGFSDHTLGTHIAIAAVARGASIIEKHFTLDKSMAGPDHAASLAPGELANLVKAIRDTEAALGDGRKVPVPSEHETAMVARKSMVAAVDIAAGETIGRSMVVMKRPGTGIAPKHLDAVLGRCALRPIRAGQPLKWDHLK